MTDKIAVTTADAPAPAHTFSQGVRKGSFVQVSGQGSVDPATNDASGASFDDVIMLRVYLTKPEDFTAMNDAYGEFVSANTSGAVLPCRTTVFTGLPRDEMLIASAALAVTGYSRQN